MEHPSCGVVRYLPNPAGPWQFSDRRLQSELQKLASAQRNRMSIHGIAAGGGAIGHATRQIQKYPGVQCRSLLPGSGSPQVLQPLLFICGESDLLPLRREWHKPFSHENVVIV
jgi:hypothetical protein